jgi:hypothetical protein
MLRPLPVDLDELADILEGDPLNAGGRVDLMTGEVWAQSAIEYVLETGEEDEDSADDPERWLPVHNDGSREGYRDMESFIASVEDPGRAERLARAIAGRGAFRRFKDELAHWPGELERWYALSEERQRGRARSWLTAAGYRVLPAAFHVGIIARCAPRKRSRCVSTPYPARGGPPATSPAPTATRTPPPTPNKHTAMPDRRSVPRSPSRPPHSKRILARSSAPPP